jgi:hypothetical protein
MQAIIFILESLSMTGLLARRLRRWPEGPSLTSSQG